MLFNDLSLPEIKQQVLPPMADDFALRDIQLIAMEELKKAYRDGSRQPLLRAPTGCHAKGQLILMKDGSFKAVESIKEGDKLMGVDGSARTVNYLCRGVGQMYKINQSNGKSYIVNDEHILSLALFDNSCSVHNISVSDYLALPFYKQNNLRGYDKYRKLSFISIDKLGIDNYYGFNLDGDQLYMLDDFTVTHNSGKSILSGELLRRTLLKNPNQRVLFTVPRLSLLEQTVSTFTDVFGFDVSVIQGIDPRLDFSKQVHVATIQTLTKRIKSNPAFEKLNFGLYIQDEAHLAFKDQDIINCDMKIGLSATPYSKGLANYFDSLVSTVSASELANQGIITPMRVIAAKEYIDPDKLGVSSTGEYIAEDEKLAANELVGDIYKEWKNCEDAQGRPFIIFARSIVTCKSIFEMFSENDVDIGIVHSKQSEEDNKAVLELFKDGLLDGVVSVNALAEGFDYAPTSCVILATSFAPNKKNPEIPNAVNKWIQCHGRGRRKSEGKSYCLVMDFGKNWERFLAPDDIELLFDNLDDTDPSVEKSTDSLSKEAKIKPSPCPECGTLMKGRFCNACGSELKTYSEVVDGEVLSFRNGKLQVLEEASGDNVKLKKKDTVLGKKTMEDKARVYGNIRHEALKILDNKGGDWNKMDGWIAYKFKECFGTWPNHPSIKKGEVAYNKDVANYLKHLGIRNNKARSK